MPSLPGSAAALSGLRALQGPPRPPRQHGIGRRSGSTGAYGMCIGYVYKM